MLEGNELDEPMALLVIYRALRCRGGAHGEAKSWIRCAVDDALCIRLEFRLCLYGGMEEGFSPHQSSIDEDNDEEGVGWPMSGSLRAKGTRIM